MKTFMSMVVALVVSLSFAVGEAEAAKRLGGGKSVGMQRESVKPSPAPNATPQAPATAGAAAAAATPKRSWLGPIAGLAAGLGLAALASHFGFGGELASMLLIGLLVAVAFVVVRMLMRRRGDAAAGGSMQYAGAGPGGVAPPANFQALPGAGSAAPARATWPVDFDVDGFTRNAKLNFIRLQASNDAANLDDIREFTSPEMYAEIKLAIDERRGAKQRTDVMQLDAQVLDVVQETGRYVVSVQFSGTLREDDDAPQGFSEIWHLTKPTDGGRGWVIAGIQQAA